MRRPPLVVVFVALLVIALGETAGAVISQLRPQIVRYAQARVAANPRPHGLAGSPEYDVEITARAVYSAEAGLSFFHTHAQGLGPLVIFASTVTASIVRWRWARGALYALFGGVSFADRAYAWFVGVSTALGVVLGAWIGARVVRWLAAEPPP